MKSKEEIQSEVETILHLVTEFKIEAKNRGPISQADALFLMWDSVAREESLN